MGWGNEVSGFDTVTKGSCAPPDSQNSRWNVVLEGPERRTRKGVISRGEQGLRGRTPDIRELNDGGGGYDSAYRDSTRSEQYVAAAVLN